MASLGWSPAGENAIELPRVRKVTAADVPRLVEALAEAFDEDPPMRWFLPDAKQRMVQIRRQFTLFIRKVHLPNGESYTTDEVVGGALWIPPGGHPVPTITQLQLIPGLIRIYGRRFGRALRGVKLMEANHPRTPHFYLDTLGVERARQGRGIGSALMRPVLARCDREKIPAYLNAGSSRSRNLYLRHGFEVTEVFELPDGGPPLWRMWREPGRP